MTRLTIIAQSTRHRLSKSLGVPELDKELDLAIAGVRQKYKRAMADARFSYDQALRTLRAEYEIKARKHTATTHSTGSLEVRPGVRLLVGTIVEEWKNATPWLTVPTWQATKRIGLVQMMTSAMLPKTTNISRYWRPEVGQLGIRVFHKHSGQLGRKWVHYDDYRSWWKEGEEPE